MRISVRPDLDRTRARAVTNSVPYKIVWIASMPRSASMWAFNITHSLLAEAGLNVLPCTVPKSDQEMVAEAPNGLRDESPNNVWCLKVRSGLQNATPANRFISTFGDPRDAIVSFMRFMRQDFGRALSHAAIRTQLCGHSRPISRYAWITRGLCLIPMMSLRGSAPSWDLAWSVATRQCGYRI
jgi:hypothetical protein